MQAGESYYNTPPPLPISLDDHAGPIPIPNHWTELPPPPPAPVPVPATTWVADTVTLPSNSGTGGSLPALMAPSKQAARCRASKRGTVQREPPTLSGFKRLTSLSVLDIDNLDIVSELKVCVKNSSSTLKELHLSLSDSLASQSRKPPPDSDPDDSDVEDEFQVVPASPNASLDGSGPAKAFRAQEERKLQEAILGRIFEVEPLITKKGHIQKSCENTMDSQDKGKEKDNTLEDPREGFVASLKGVSNKLMTLLNGSRDFSSSQQEILDVIEKAARKYVDSGDVPSQVVEDQTKGQSQSDPIENTDDQAQTTASDGEGIQSSGVVAGPSEGQSDEPLPSAMASLNLGESVRRKRLGKEIGPEDIDIEHLDSETEVFEESDALLVKDKGEKMFEYLTPQELPNVLDDTTSPGMTPALEGPVSLLREEPILNFSGPKTEFQSIMSKLRDFQEQADSLGQQIKDMLEVSDTDIDHVEEAEARLAQLFRWSNDIQYQIKMMEHEIKNVDGRTSADCQATSKENEQRSIDDYLRDTRGLSLETLSIHLIPLKPSVLSRAIDLSSLKNLTLLNVGSQVGVWTLLSKENKARPLALRNVFTDNVSNAFLTCMSQLEELHELFMLERSAKHKPESFAPKSTIKIDQIRRLVLKKHMHTLKRLMIKDESSSSNWDMNQKAMILICNRGSQLEELAVSMNIHAVVSLILSTHRSISNHWLARIYAVFCRTGESARNQHPSFPQQRHMYLGNARDPEVHCGQPFSSPRTQIGMDSYGR